MKISGVFTRLSKLLPAYGKIPALILRVEGGVFTVTGVNKNRAFGFSVEVEEKIEDFSFIVSPESLQPVLNLIVTDICVAEGKLTVNGTLGRNENSPVLKVACLPANAALIKEAEALAETIQRIIGMSADTTKICDTNAVLKPWLALSKCGKRLFLTDDLTYSLSASASAFYSKDATYVNLPTLDTNEPIQMENTFPAEVQAVIANSDIDNLEIHVIKEGSFFVAVSEDKAVFALSCASVPQKYTLQKIRQLHEDTENFETIQLQYSAVRDVLLSSADKQYIEIVSGDNNILFKSGALGKIVTDTRDFACECLVARDHTTLALRALPVDAIIEFGYGESGGRTFAALSAGGVNILIPAQDITEV